MDSEGCFYNALSTYLEGLDDLERRQVYYVVENDEDLQDGTRDVVISDPIEEGNEERFEFVAGWSVWTYDKCTPCFISDMKPISKWI